MLYILYILHILHIYYIYIYKYIYDIYICVSLTGKEL